MFYVQNASLIDPRVSFPEINAFVTLTFWANCHTHFLYQFIHILKGFCIVIDLVMLIKF